MDQKNSKQWYALSASIVLASAMLAGAIFYSKTAPAKNPVLPGKEAQKEYSAVIPPKATLPVTWEGLGRALIETGLIDKEKFESVYASRGEMGAYERELLYGSDAKNNIEITGENAGVLLNLFWALGLGQKSAVLDRGPMMDPRYGNGIPAPERFASTGGWTLAMGNAMDHYSKHAFFNLSSEAEDRVEEVAKNIYRPCCGNSTHFPDCNHGMAMLGFLELMASQGASEKEMYDAALTLNSYWFPDTYRTIAAYLAAQNVSWQDVEPKTLLGADFSSAAGYRRILESAPPQEKPQGGSCGV